MAKKKALTLDERDEVASVIGHAGTKALFKLLEACLEDLKDDVLKHSLSNGDERGLVHKKLRHEGAAKLLWAFHEQLKALKAGQDA